MRAVSTGQLARPIVPLLGILALSLAATTLRTVDTNWSLVAVAAAVGAVALVIAAVAPWARLPVAALLVLPVVCDGVIALLRQAQGGSTSGYAPLAILPVVWVGLTLGAGEVAAITAVTAALFYVPLVALGAPLYPATGWRGAALWTIVAAIVGAAAHHVIGEQRRRTRELDRLVATQHAIGTSAFDLDNVMATVVEEAQQLTNAAASVIELPDGDELVYRAVAGTAASHLGLRLKQSATLSGAALRERRVLVCVDSEQDPRVDADACRRVGARSMVVIPLIHDGEAVGVLKVYAPTANAFGAEHENVLHLLGGIVATALARADLMKQLGRQAGTDDLTGLVNRRSWYEQLERSLALARRWNRPLSVIVLDVNELKRTNDVHGHAAGDRLLRTIASHWTNALRQGDVLGRLGGDEFGVVVHDADAGAAAQAVERLAAVLPGWLSASAGSATWDGEEPASELVSRADARMYDAKRDSRLARR